MTTAIEGGFQFRGITPDANLQSEAWRVFDEIANLAPYNAYLEAQISRSPEGYLVEVHIASDAGQFNARVQASDWPDALLQIEHEMQRKFEAWRQQRFDHHASAWEFAA